MRRIFGFILIILSIPMALYVGVWFCFIGGIVDIINAIKITPVPALEIAIGITKVFGSSIAGVVSFWLMLIPGWGLLSGDKIRIKTTRKFL